MNNKWMTSGALLIVIAMTFDGSSVSVITCSNKVTVIVGEGTSDESRYQIPPQSGSGTCTVSDWCVKATITERNPATGQSEHASTCAHACSQARKS